MKFIEDIKEETLVICNDSFKKKVLSLNKLLPIKFMKIEEFIKKYVFDYSEEAILYVINNYHVKYEVAKMYIDNLYYVDDINYGNDKLDFLVGIKKDLIRENLLIFNDDFRKYVDRVAVVLYDIKMTKYLLKILSSVNYRVIEREYHENDHIIYSFDSMEEECEYVAYQICKLIDMGIDVNKIKITNIDKSYYNVIERVFSLFNLRVNIPYKSKLSSFKMVREFIDVYRESNLQDAFLVLDKNSDFYEDVLKIINKYNRYDDKDLLIYKLENAYIYANDYDKGIEIIDYLGYVSDETEYIFMMNFNDGMVPNSYLDMEYITDNICSYVNKDTTRERNRWLREDILRNIRDIKNLVITYKDRDMTKSYYPSTLCSYFKVVRGSLANDFSYSEVYNKIKLMDRYDNYIKYGTISDDFGILKRNFKINYKSYSNKYSKIKRVMNGLTLSYSKMQIYNKCAFRYYLSEILKLNIFEENFSAVIGSMVHYVLEKCLSNNDMDTDKYVMEYIADKSFSKKENFFLEKYKIALKELLEEIMLEREYSLFNQAMYEKKITIDYGENVKFVGIIDKILYYIDDDKTYIALIDYKTGHDGIDLKYLKYGLDIQLPIYLYLASKLEFNNPLYVGFYLQRFNINERDYRLLGYSNSDKDILRVIDKNYDNSKVIKSLRTLKDGNFAKNAKVISNDKIDEIKDCVEDIILDTINKIKNNVFDINPKVIDGKNKGCEYCKFYDICNVNKDDMIYINTSDDEEVKDEEYD